MNKQEQLDIVRQMIADGVVTQEQAAKYFSELAESEDEKILKAIYQYLYNVRHNIGQLTPYTDEFDRWIAWLEKRSEQKPNPYSGTSFEYNGHIWGMCARDNGVEILIDGHIKGRVFTNDSNAKEMFIKALERVEEQNNKGYKLTDCDKNSWWEDFKAYTSCTIEQKPDEWSEEDTATISRVISIVKWAAYSDHSHPILNDKGATELVERLKSLRPKSYWQPSEEMLEALYRAVPQNVKEMSEDEILLDKLYQALKYGIVLK